MNCRLRRLMSTLLVFAMLVGFIPPTMFNVAKAADGGEKSPIDKSTYEDLGFPMELEATSESYLNGNTGGKTTMNVKNELYLDYQAHKNYGWVLRDNLNFKHTSWNGYDDIGAYRLYGQYMDYGKTDDLDGENGWTYGQTGGEGSLIGSGITSTGSHKSRAYKTAVEYRTASGKKDMVAQLYVTSGTNRTDWVAKLELLKYTYNETTGKYTPSVTSTVTLGASPALDESGMIFQQYFDALYDITAGDFDGDGIDEIAVYYGTNEVRIYDTGAYGTSLKYKQTIGEDELLKDRIDPSQPSDSEHPYGDGSSTHKFVHRAAIVTLTAGDLKKDFSDDLVITVSMPQENDKDAQEKNPYAYIYDYRNSSYVKDEEISLYVDNLQGDESKPAVFKAANATIGDIDGDACMELIIGGRLCEVSSLLTYDSTNWGVGAIIPVEYDHGSGKYSVGTATQMKLDEYDEDKILINDGIEAQCLRYTAPVGMAVADLDGVGSDAPHLFFFSELFTYDADTKSFKGTGKYLDTIKNQTNNVNESESKGQHWVSDVVVGNFNGNDDGADQIIAIVACKQEGNTKTDQDWYWYYMSYIAKETEKKPDGSIGIKGDGEICRQCEGIINQGRSYINRTDKSRASTFVSIACPDVDNDSILLEHLDTETYYSKPEVQAVLQSAPYFADVAEVYDNNYLDNSETAYGNLDASSQGVQASVSAKLGAYVDVEFQAGAAADLEAELAVTTSYEHASIDEVETEVSHSGAAGDDYVVMYTIPYIRYYYNATYPDGKTGLMKIEEPLTPATVIVPVETYDEIAATTEGLEPIRGNILTSTPGEPMTYLSPPKGEWQTIGDIQALTNAGSNSGSTVTVSQSVTETTEHSFAVGIEENFKIGFGTGAVGNKVTAGITQGLSADAGGVYSNMGGVVYTGAVDNLPAGVTGYAFNWQFGISKTKLNGEDIIVVGYTTSKVKQAPSITRNLAVTEVGSDYVELEWNKNNDAAMYELSISRDGNTWNLLKSIPATAAVDNTVRYRVTDLSDDTVFYFKVGASNAFGIRSLDSASVSAVTLAGENVSFEITNQPTNISTHAGGNASFYVGTKTNISSDIHYEWQYNDGDGWFKIGYDSPALTISDVTKAMDGRAVRCRVSQVANYMYSQVAYLEVSKSETETELQIMNGTTPVEDADIVNASVIEYEPILGEITIWKEDDADGYLKMADKETVDTDGNHSYDGATFIWSKTETKVIDGKEKTVVRYYDKTGSGESASYTEYKDFKNTFHKITVDENNKTTDVVIKTASDTTTLDQEVTIKDGKTSSSGYLIDNKTDEYVYVVVENLTDSSTPDDEDDDAEDKDNPANTKTTYYVKEGEFFIEVSLGDTIIVIGGNDYYISSFVPVMVADTDNIITGYTPVHSDGDVLTFTATVDKGKQAAALAGSASFQLRNLATGLITTVPATKNDDGKTFTATHTFTETGLFSVTAVYGGDASYFGSTSDPVVIYVSADSATLSITGGTITYGDSLKLKPTLYTKDVSGGKTGTPVAGVSYTVALGNRPPLDNTIVNDVFTPTEAGNYVINASYTVEEGENAVTYTAIANVTVNKKTLTITANDAKASISQSESERRNLLTCTIPEGVSVTPKLSSDAVTAVSQGDYTINISIPDTDRTVLETKYSIVLVSGTYTLTQESVYVAVATGTNGSAIVSYTTTVTDTNGTYTSSPLIVDNDSHIPKGATVTVTARPNSGFGVEKWTINGVIANDGNVSYTIENLNSPQDIYISFTHTLNTLSFNAEGDGTVTGVYAGTDNAPFASGNSINSTQTVILTATPAEGYVVSHWTKQVVGDEPETLKTEKGNNYTGDTVEVSGVNANTTYTAHFVANEAKTVTIQFVDKANDHVLSSNVGVISNRKIIEPAENMFTINTFVHDNLDIEIKIPDNMMVDHWKLDGNNYSDSTKSISLENIEDNMAFTVVCVAPTQRELTFKAELLGTNGGELANAGTISAKRDGVDIDFTNDIATLPQGTVIDFTATASAGYRINKWTIDGTPATGADIGTLQTTLSADKKVIVYFEKLPTVSVTEHDPDNGSVEFVIDVATIQNPVSYVVDFGTKVQVNIKPVKGYVIGSVLVDDAVKALSTPSVVGGTDERYFELDNVNTNTNIEVTYAALDTTDVTFGIVDKNGADTDGGLDGEIKASVNRNDIDSYKIENADTLEPVYEGSVVTFTATPAEGYKVSKWFVNGVEYVESENESAFAKDGNTATLTIENGMDEQDIMVQFDLIGEEITFSIDSEETNATISATFTPNGGTAENFVSGSRPATNGVVAITVADIADGYEIEGWYVNEEMQMDGENAITSETFNYNATADVGADIYVKIIRSSYKVDFSAVNGTVTAMTTEAIASGDSIKGDTEVTFIAAPQEATGYEFTGWTVNGEASEETTETLILTITENTTVKATYKLIQVKYDVTYGVIGENGTLKLNGYDKSPAKVNAGANLTFTATPATGYRVAGWYSDAEGTTAIAGTTFEQNTYSTTNLVADMTVYVKFEPIPTYDITVNVEGLGSVTATVNGKAVEITGGNLTVNRYDDVVLTAAPGEYQYFAGWTVGGENKGNELTLTLTDVVENANVKATFAASQNITLKTIVGEGGTMTVKAGYGDNLTELDNINPETGIVINRGQKVVFEITPAEGKMVKSWKVNDVEMTDYLDHEYIIENITADTVIEVVFEDLTTFAVPSGTAQYTIENIIETPVDIASESGDITEVRDRGNVTFDVVPVSPNAITELEVSAGTDATVETKMNADGTWTVTITKVTADITFSKITVVEGKPLIIDCGAGGTVEVTLNGTKVENGYAFQADDVITVKAKANSGYTLESLKLNGADFTSGKTYTVKADDNAITIVATFKAAPAGGGGGGFGGGGGGGASATYPPVIEETDNGKLIVTPEEPSKGDEVVITPVPDPGYMLDKIVVTDKNDKEIETEFNRDGTYSFEQPAGEVTIDAEFKKIVLPFEDVSDKAYYAEAVLWAVENGITTGVTPTLFMPDMVCTRAQAVTFLWRAAGSPAPKSADMHFTDVPENAYYYDAVIWALENGITTGTNDGSTFSPDMVCSRSQIVTLIARMEKAEKAEAENPFTDVKDTDYYYESVLWAVDNYITNGTTETTFAPVKDCTRAEIVTFLWRAFR